ncbi:hypothetical protein NP233_g2630 [Leucocoprinus birnbaumii]|uniref:TPR-like protein n=1 Tax=Leucocoprinus birnbaumii TaxID=56174 RepID=A0AAD5VZY6_9AGAR|nr:hypothetical protein NP233_g2630 [Leucocoprinus birnbaumii]
MIPRSVNPHIVLEQTQIVSRKDLEPKDEEYEFSQPDMSLLDEFNAVMKRTFPQYDIEERPKKRRKGATGVEKGEERISVDESILFRLISRGPPVPVSLKPKPEALINVKGPEVEDNEAEAKERREQAVAVAVDAAWIMDESRKPCQHPSIHGPALHLKLPQYPVDDPAIMVLCHNKPIRKTRPPVTDKLKYPYDASAKPEPIESPARCASVIDLNRTLDHRDSKKRKRRRTCKVKTIDHRFWRPNPDIKAKCMGYAMGFDPSSQHHPFALLQDGNKKTKSSLNKPHPLANDTTDVFQDSEDDADDESDYEWGMVDRMRLWRHDALMQHLYETAAFWGDKILSWTNDPNDAFWLAQTYFMTHQYSRAERLLTRPFSTSQPKSPSTPPPAANGQSKGKGKEADISQSVNPQRLPMGPAGIIEVTMDQQEKVSRLVDMSVACRYLAAQCQMRQGNWSDALEMLGEANPFRDSEITPGRSGPSIPNLDGGIKVEASMCHLRGILMLKLNRGDQAKQCFMEALALDVKCFEAFDQLVTGEMMTPEEEWEFIQGLSYSHQTPQDAQFVQLIYTSRLRKYKHTKEHALTRKKLVEEYNLGDNPDVLFSFADASYASFRWADCFTITSRVLGLVAIHNPTMPLHIACMYHLQHLHSKLFMLAHEMVDREPENPISWYAVGVWYLSGGKWHQARQYFSKTSLMDPRFAPAWIAFGHTFALEGEHDHAVTAYSTCARMFTGSHLPLMFVGMEHIMLSNYALADEALNAAYTMCNGDPLLQNERGVMAYNHGDFEKAATLFQEALELAQITQSSRKSWATTYINLGTCYRRLGRLDDAQDTYKKVLELDPRHAVALGFLGMVYHLKGDLDQAIVRYHESLSVDPTNSHILECLHMAIDTVANQFPGHSQESEFRQAIKELKETYLKMGVKFKGKERSLLGLGLPRSHLQATAASASATTGVAASSSAAVSAHGNGQEEEGDEMSIG